MVQAEVREIDGVSLPPVGRYELDPFHTTVGFEARHLLTRTTGRFTDVTGAIEVGETPEASGVEVEIQTASVESSVDKRDEHLRSADFFEVETYPVITFRSTAVRHTGGPDFELDGDLTIRDVTKQVTLSGKFLGWGKDPFENTVLSAEARTTVEREDWGLTWNMAVESGGLLVGKKADIVIDVEAKKTD